MTGDNRIEWVRYCYALSKPFDKFYGEDFPTGPIIYINSPMVLSVLLLPEIFQKKAGNY